MADPVYVALAEVQQIAGVHRRARLETGTVVQFGVHGPIKAHYRLEGAAEVLWSAEIEEA
jgi:hypothetical protein